MWIRERTPTPSPDLPTPLTARHPTPEIWSARSPSLDLETVRNPTPLLSPMTTRNPSLDLESAHYPTPTPSTARELTRKFKFIFFCVNLFLI